MKKEFLTPEIIRNNAIILAKKIHSDKITPTIIYVSLRGGATFGNVISEYFKLLSPTPHLPLYAAVVAHSYGTFESDFVYVDGWTYPPHFIRPSDTVMLIDDIFDSGKTINVIASEILRHGVPRKNLKIVVHDYKIRLFQNVTHDFIPDYYTRKIIVKTPEDDNWIHYLSHEMDGLTHEEIKKHYPKEIQQHIMDIINIRTENKKNISD